MKFIKELIASKKNGSGGAVDREAVERDLEEGGFDSPLLNRQRQALEARAPETDEVDEELAQALETDEDQEELEHPGDAEPMVEAVEDLAETEVRAEFENEDEDQDNHTGAKYEAAFEDELEARADATADTDEILDEDEDFYGELDDDEDDDEEWNIGLISDVPEPKPHPASAKASTVPAMAEEDDLDDEIFQDPEQAENVEQAALEAVETRRDLSEAEKEELVEEIRLAMAAVRHIRSDDEIGRQMKAREQLESDSSTDSRILDETNAVLQEDKGARRRQAIAVMKAAAEATRSDPILQDMVGRDPSNDPEEQQDYRDDLASFVQPSLPTSRNRTRPASEPVEDIVTEDHAEDTLAAADPVETGEAREPEAQAEIEAEENHDDAAEAIMNAVASEAAAVIEAAADETEGPEEESSLSDEPEMADQDGKERPSTANLRDALMARARVSEGAPNRERPPTRPPSGRHIWDMQDNSDEPTDDTEARAASESKIVEVPQPAVRGGRQAGRVKTRLLGFGADSGEPDIFDASPETPSNSDVRFPVGWLVVTDGPGRGASFAVSAGVSHVGRGDDQSVRLDFGDNSISRQNHAAIAYDDEQSAFYLGHGGKSNLVRLNGKPVLSTEELSDRDQIRIGETTLLFVALCKEGFDWHQQEGGNAGKAAIA